MITPLLTLVATGTRTISTPSTCSRSASAAANREVSTVTACPRRASPRASRSA